MPAKVTGPAETCRDVDRWAAGVGWIENGPSQVRTVLAAVRS